MAVSGLISECQYKQMPPSELEDESHVINIGDISVNSEACAKLVKFCYHV